MESKDEFDFLNSDIWLKYTQERYVSLKDIKYRLDTLGFSRTDWPDLKQNIERFRKMGAIPLFLNSISKKFWFFPSDSILQKTHEVENTGSALYDKIKNHSSFEKEFLANAAVEEAISSALYEGANSTRSKAKALIASGDTPKDKDEWMLINNYNAMKWIKENSEKAVTNEIVLKVHDIVAKNTLEGDDTNFCGKFRNDAVFVGPHEGIKHEKVSEALNEAISLATGNRRYLHGLIRGIILHYFIAYIHPFFDGNGRTARTLFYYKAIKNDLKFVELLSVSANLKEHGKKYEKSFDLVKEHGLDITYFIDFCLDSLLAALGKVNSKVDFLISVAKLTEHLGINKNQVSLLQRMALNKFREITIEEYAESINRSREIARKELKDLHGKGLLRDDKKGKKTIYFVESKKLKKLVDSLA